jgi:hypothetical protein
MESSFYMWGERGLVATFFADLHVASSAGLSKFLEAIEIDSPTFPRNGHRLLTIIEPDFSNTGFGHPDAVIRIDGDSESAVIVLEAKRCPYLKASKSNRVRSAEGFNSTLNGQLELDYALALALAEHQPTYSELLEPAWVLNTPYAQERNGRLGRLKNPNVLRGVVSNFAGLPLRHYFFVVLTTDGSNPFSSLIPEDLLPGLYQLQNGLKNCWTEMHTQFGWLNYEKLRNLAELMSTQGLLPGGSLFLGSLGLNLANMDISSHNPKPGIAVTRGVALIYAPKIDSATFLHFSWLGEGCALRNYSLHPDRVPSPDRGYQTSEIRSLVERHISADGRRSIEDTQFWHQRTSEANLQLLPVSRGSEIR